MRIQATVTMQGMVLHHAPTTLHLRDVLGLAPNRCFAFHAVPAIVLLCKDPIVVARHMRRPKRRHNARRGRQRSCNREAGHLEAAPWFTTQTFVFFCSFCIQPLCCRFL